MACKHGQQQRKCPICERDKTIAEQQAYIDELREKVERLEKAVAYYRIRNSERPPFVPSRVRLNRRVRGDFPIGHQTCADAGDYDCECNQYGAVTIMAQNGRLLGLKFDEFEPLAWRDNQQTAAEAAEEETE